MTESTTTHTSSQKLEQDIDQTRARMDRTLEEIGDRLHPKHLLDDILGFFRSSGREPSEYTQITRNVGREVLNKVKQHPLPALLCGAGLAWLLLEGDGQEEPQERKSRRPRREFDHRPEARDAYMEEYMEELDDPYEDWSDTPFYAAWEDEYDWSAAAEDEASWSERAQQAVQEIRATLAAEGLPEKEKMRTLAGKLVGVSGRTREEIHAQWADLPEHSGSVVDARTGQPYEESYGRRWRGLGAAHYASSQDWPEQEDAAWSGEFGAALRRFPRRGNPHSPHDTDLDRLQTLDQTRRQNADSKNGDQDHPDPGRHAPPPTSSIDSQRRQTTRGRHRFTLARRHTRRISSETCRPGQPTVEF
jgi:hypothetical protein